jgi:hypothetical protein
MAAFASSYIKTEGSAVTRAADAASMTGANFSSWYRADRGTMYAEALIPQVAQVSSLFAFSDGTANNRTQLRKNTAQGNVVVLSNGAVQVNMTAGSWTTTTESQKASVAYKVNDFAFSTGGSAIASDTSAILPIVNQAEIGFGQGSNYANGTIKKLAFYPERLSDAQLQALTS